jgi:FkbM family methyltransferase
VFETFTFDDILTYVAIKGFVHIGGHNAEEHEKYKNFPVLWVEGHPDYAAKLAENIAWEPYQISFEALLSDTDGEEVDFYITKDEFASSMLKPALHQELFPHAPVTDVIKLRTKRFDTLIEEQSLKRWMYNVLILDVQGAELKVLKGMGDLLQKFPVVICEYTVVELYEGSPRLDDLDEFLSSDYKRVHPTDTHELVGDAMYVRRT